MGKIPCAYCGREFKRSEFPNRNYAKCIRCVDHARDMKKVAVTVHVVMSIGIVIVAVFMPTALAGYIPLWCILGLLLNPFDDPEFVDNEPPYESHSPH